jgi:hypothetical protein
MDWSLLYIARLIANQGDVIEGEPEFSSSLLTRYIVQRSSVFPTWNRHSHRAGVSLWSGFKLLIRSWEFWYRTGSASTDFNILPSSGSGHCRGAIRGRSLCGDSRTWASLSATMLLSAWLFARYNPPKTDQTSDLDKLRRAWPEWWPSLPVGSWASWRDSI